MQVEECCRLRPIRVIREIRGFICIWRCGCGNAALRARLEKQSALFHLPTFWYNRHGSAWRTRLKRNRAARDPSKGFVNGDATFSPRLAVCLALPLPPRRLFPVRLQAEIADLAPLAQPLVTISSPFGHDGFLVEVELVGNVIKEALALS